MEPSTYSIIADLLAKFHTSSEWIQALWLVTLPAMVVGVSWRAADVLKALIARGAPRRTNAPLTDMPPPGDVDAQWLAYRNGELWLMRLPTLPLSSLGAEGKPGTHHHDEWR
jgi:hypothetical protein